MPADGATLAANADDLARLYDEYGAKIYRYCLGRLRSKEDAEDAQQNTFLRVYTALRQGTVPAYEAAWLYKIAHNVCLSRVESAAARSRVETPRDLAALEAELAAPSGRRDELIGLEDALAELPANLRQAILLREWQGLSYTEIAEALGVSVSAVETLIFRARRRLAQTLEQGVARPARRISTALNLPWLYGRLGNAIRSLVSAGRVSLAAAGPAKIVAAAALVAAGGGGVGTGLALGTSHGTVRVASQPGRHVVRQAGPAADRRAGAAEPTRAAGPSLAGAAAGGVSQAPALPPATGAGPAPGPGAAPAGDPPEARPAPIAGTPAPGTTSTAVPTTTAVSTTIVSTTAAAATAAVPTVTTLSTLPAPSVPVLTIPSPGVSVPELPSLPTIVDPPLVGTTTSLPPLVTTAGSPQHP